MTSSATLPHISDNGDQPKTAIPGGSFQIQLDPELDENSARTGTLQSVKNLREPSQEEMSDREEERAESLREDIDFRNIDTDTEQERQHKIILHKDAEEEELERTIFGNSAGFKNNLANFSLNQNTDTLDEYSCDVSARPLDLNNVADKDLFFFDSGPVPMVMDVTEHLEKEDSEGENGAAAWEDSDDERLVVSLVSVPQLRKLRETVEDDTVNGKEYSRRLRKQYEKLYPTPEWALYARGATRPNKRRATGGEESDGGSANGTDVDEDDLSTQPLARLLKDADILTRTSRTSSKWRKMQAGTIDIERLKDVVKTGASAVTSLSFHPSLPLLLSSGPSSTLNLYHICPSLPNPNPLLTSLHIKNTPLTTTVFHPLATDSRIFLSARRRYFHIWNITTGKVEKISRIYGHQHEQRTMEYFFLSPDGKYMALRGSSRKGGGVVSILDATTLQWITQIRVESRGGIADFVWWSDGSGLSIAGKNGEITEWSIDSGVVGRWNDEGAVGTTKIALGGKSGREGFLGGDRWVAVGSSSGIVNIYDRRAWAEARTTSNDGIPRMPIPLRAVQNLTTPISHLHFSADGQVLAMASRWKNNAMRLIHLPSGLAFKNWPTERTPLGRITAIAWGRVSDEEEQDGCLAQLVVANEAGAIRMWEIRA